MVAATSRSPWSAAHLKRGAQIGQLHGEPHVRLPLARAVPQRQDVGFPPGEVPGMGCPGCGRRSVGGELFLGELADRLHIEYRVRLVDWSATSSDLRTSASSTRGWRTRRGRRIPRPRRRFGGRTAGEHRTSVQQRLFRVVEQVVGPRHRMTQRLVAFQSAPEPTNSWNR